MLLHTSPGCYHNHDFFCFLMISKFSLLWRHNGHDGISNHQPQDCLLNRLFRRRSKKTPKLSVTGLCEGYSPVTGEFHAERLITRKMFPFDDVIMDLVSFLSRRLPGLPSSDGYFYFIIFLSIIQWWIIFVKISETSCNASQIVTLSQFCRKIVAWIVFLSVYVLLVIAFSPL